MFKQISMLAVVGLAVVVMTETESLAQGFGGYHRAAATARNVNIGRGVNLGVRGSAYRPGGYRGVGGVGYGGYGRTLPYGAYSYGGDVYLPPNPGPGPQGIDAIGKGADRGDKSRTSAQEQLNASLNQMKLPSDAGLPPASASSGKSKK